ncbi:MAG: hypothetical protein NTX44_08490 [Ignavibacteriales bacterium]|nr:hypothetical protein [Ignavibacteriales bacterium]
MNTKNRYNVVLQMLALCVLAIAVIVLHNGCTKQYTNQPHLNTQPQTFLWLYPSDTSIADGVSRQQLHWWGEDRDGFVNGYLLSVVPDLIVVPHPDTLAYRFVTSTDSLIAFPLRQARQTFLVDVHAVDNTFTYPLPAGSIIRITPFSYWDQNGNGIFDGTDVRLNTLADAMDPNGAKQRFPTINTPPAIDYVFDSANDTMYAQPPSQTFTVAGFSWVGHDFDGDETIASFRISLNDSLFSHPFTIPSSVTTITLAVPRSTSDAATSSLVDADVLWGTSPNLHKAGTVSGLHMDANNTLYVQSVDVAGAMSKSIVFPSKGNRWYVKKPRGNILMVVDYDGTDLGSVQSFYVDSVFKRINGITTDTLNLADGKMIPSGQHVNPALTKTLKLYNCVVWFTDPSPNLDLARNVLFDYWSSSDGGHLIYSAHYADPNAVPDAGHAYRDIAPIDSLGSAPLSVTKFTGIVSPDSSVSADIYPVMGFKSRVAGAGICIFPLYPNAAAHTIYFLPATTSYPLTSAGVIDDTKRVIFFNIPLDRMAATSSIGNSGVVEFFKKAFSEFGLQ